MVHAFRTILALLLCSSSAALAGDIYRQRTSDGRVIFTDNPARGEGVIETARLDDFGNRLKALVVPGAQPSPAERDRAAGDVRTAEAELMRAYNRLTANVLPRPDEIMQDSVTDPAPPGRGRRPKLQKTPEYYQRIELLKADIDRAQERVDQARARHYAMK